MSSSRPRPWLTHLGDLSLALYPLSLVLLTLVALIAPRSTGLLALSQVFAHFLFAPLLLLLPLALWRRLFLVRLSLASAAATFLLVYPPALNLLPPRDSTGPTLTVMSWNLFVGEVTNEALHAALDQYDPDLVLLQEALWEPLHADQALLTRYPYHLLHPNESAPGLAILSRLPIREAGVPPAYGHPWDQERIVWARVELAGQLITVINAHPIPPRTFADGCSLLRCYNLGPRDAQISALHEFVEELHQRTGDPLIFGGDMNVTEREPAYFELAAGLRDAQRAVGQGFGASWRPHRIAWPVGFIRIDYLFSDHQLRPLSLTTDCTLRGSDHCLLVGRFTVAGREQTERSGNYAGFSIVMR
jgi:endonuclease/exonuclease/phosphatase (EEP) superfamily protein YafD